MNTCLVKLTLIAGGAVLASHALAQPPAQPSDVAVAATVGGAASAPRASTVTTNVAAKAAANTRPALPTTVTRTVNAAGSVLVLADGIVANATIAQIHPPAPGFVYER